MVCFGRIRLYGLWSKREMTCARRLCGGASKDTMPCYPIVDYNPHTLASVTGFSAFLFDLDGTLINSIDLIMAAFRHTMRTHLDKIPTDDAWRVGLGTPLRTQLAKYAVSDDHADAMANTYRAYTRAFHGRLVRPYPGIKEALGILRDRGVKLGIVTSKSRPLARRGLQRCGLDEYFDVLVGVEDVTEHKPHPAPVLDALGRLLVEPHGAVFVGDSPHDVRSGRAAGVATAAVLWGDFGRTALAAHAPDYWLANPNEIAVLQP